MAEQILQPESLDRTLKPFGAVGSPAGSPRASVVVVHSVQRAFSVNLDGPADVSLDAGGVVEEVTDPQLKVEGHLKRPDRRELFLLTCG